MHRFLALLLLVLLPIQFSWAAVASYCEFEKPAASAHFGHHEHRHDHGNDHRLRADTGSDVKPVADVKAAADAKSFEAPGTLHLDCGQCHGHGSMMLNVPLVLPGVMSTAPPSATLDQADGAHAPTRPERPQWQPFA